MCGRHSRPHTPRPPSYEMILNTVLWESPEAGGNWGYGAGFARPIPPYLSIHHGNSQRAINTFVRKIMEK